MAEGGGRMFHAGMKGAVLDESGDQAKECGSTLVEVVSSAERRKSCAGRS